MLGKVLVTGGLGNLGSWVSKALSMLGYEVYILTRKEKYTMEGYVYKVIEVDISDIKALKEKLTIQFDFCIHMASYNEFFHENYPEKALKINAMGTRNLLEVLVEKNVKKFIYLSTVHVYGTREGVVKEDDVLSPQNDYATTHLFAEYYVKQFGVTHELDYAILRLTNSYGTPVFYDNSKWYLVLNNLVKNAYENKLILLKSNGEVSRDFIWMGDVALVIQKILSCSCGGIYNLSSMQNYKIINLAEMVKSVYEKRYNGSIDISLNKKDKTRYKTSLIDNHKLQDLLAYGTKNHFFEEIDKIFSLLEQHDKR